MGSRAPLKKHRRGHEAEIFQKPKPPISYNIHTRRSSKPRDGKSEGEENSTMYRFLTAGAICVALTARVATRNHSIRVMGRIVSKKGGCPEKTHRTSYIQKHAV